MLYKYPETQSIIFLHTILLPFSYMCVLKGTGPLSSPNVLCHGRGHWRWAGSELGSWGVTRPALEPLSSADR